MKYAAILVLFNLALVAHSQTIYYVNASSGNDGNPGTSWDFAFASFQKALDAVNANDQIWLAAGTYTPTHDANGQIPTDPRDATFLIDQSNLQVFGGFPTSGFPTMMDRNTDQYPTYLSGEIGTANLTDNVYTVAHVRDVGQTSLTGLYIESGYADGNIGAIRRRGGGLYHETSGGSSRLDLIECRFFGNFAHYGGALYHVAAGGAVQTSLNRCELSGNLADSYGGAIYFAGDNGGGFIDIRNSIFNGNSAGLNGGAFAYDDGGIGGSPSTFIHCTFYDNSAVNGGGVAAIHFWDSNQSPPQFRNCIFNSNTPPSMVQNATNQGSFDVRFCVFDEISCPTTVIDCLANYSNSDPQFVDPANGDFALNACSPILDRGDPGISEPFDFDGDSRTGTGAPDPGAQEYLGAPCCSGAGVIYVDAAATGLNNGTSWTDAFTDLQTAIDFENTGSCSGQSIWVAAGTYSPSSDTSGNTSPVNPRDKTFHTANFVSLFGGFAGFETNLSQRNPSLNPTILSGDIGTAAATDNAYTVFYFKDGRSRINGFIITDGRADGPIGGPRGEGGGIYVGGHSLFVGLNIVECVISNNYARRGGGIYLTSSACFSSNGLNCSSTRLDQNTALLEGGAIYVDANDMIITPSSFVDCSFTNNQASTNLGGAIYYHGGFTSPGLGNGLRFDNCLFANNSAPQGGSVLAYDDDDGLGLKFYHSSFYGNSSSSGAALEIVGWTDGQAPISMINSLLWNNGANFPTTGTTYFQLFNCLVQEPACPAVAQCSAVIFNEDPRLLDPASGDYHLTDCSPAVNAGKDTTGVSGVDFEGDNRPTGSLPDIGYDEYTGNGCCPPGNAYFVNAAATGANTGQSWTDAFISLQAAALTPMLMVAVLVLPKYG